MPNVSIGDHFETFISQKVAEGRFQNASEVVRAGLRLLEDQELARNERVARLAREIKAAFDEPGEDVPVEEAFEEIERQYQADISARAHGA